MLDAPFYATVLPGLVRRECGRRADCTPVVQLHLADGTVFEVCDILQLADQWLAVSYHRDKTCTASDFVFLSHAVVTRVLVSLEPAEKRRLGFRHLESASATSEEETSIAGQEASNG